MAKGGKRPGAGRKEGSVTKKTRAIAEKAMQQGITPLEVLIEAMRFNYQAARKARSPVQKARYLHFAAHHAKDAAPYMHPRLAAIHHSSSGCATTQPQPSAPMSFDEIAARLQGFLDRQESTIARSSEDETRYSNGPAANPLP